LGIIRKCTLALHVSKGIQSIHQIKAAHRDIKSKNVQTLFFFFFFFNLVIN